MAKSSATSTGKLYVQNFNSKKRFKCAVDNLAFEKLVNYPVGETDIEQRKNALIWAKRLRKKARASMLRQVTLRRDREISRDLMHELVEAENLGLLKEVDWVYRGNFYHGEAAQAHPETSFSIKVYEMSGDEDDDVSDVDIEDYLLLDFNKEDDEEKQLVYLATYGYAEGENTGYSAYSYTTTLSDAIEFITTEFKTTGWDNSFNRIVRVNVRSAEAKYLKKHGRRLGKDQSVPEAERKKIIRYCQNATAKKMQSEAWNNANIARVVDLIRRSADTTTLFDSCDRFIVEYGKKLLKEAVERDLEEKKARRLSDDNIIDLDDEFSHLQAGDGIQEERPQQDYLAAGSVVDSSYSSTGTLGSARVSRDITGSFIHDEEDGNARHDDNAPEDDFVIASAEDTEASDSFDVEEHDEDNHHVETPLTAEEIRRLSREGVTFDENDDVEEDQEVLQEKEISSPHVAEEPDHSQEAEEDDEVLSLIEQYRNDFGSKKVAVDAPVAVSGDNSSEDLHARYEAISLETRRAKEHEQEIKGILIGLYDKLEHTAGEGGLVNLVVGKREQVDQEVIDRLAREEAEIATFIDFVAISDMVDGVHQFYRSGYEQKAEKKESCNVVDGDQLRRYLNRDRDVLGFFVRQQEERRLILNQNDVFKRALNAYLANNAISVSLDNTGHTNVEKQIAARLDIQLDKHHEDIQRRDAMIAKSMDMLRRSLDYSHVSSIFCEEEEQVEVRDTSHQVADRISVFVSDVSAARQVERNEKLAQQTKEDMAILLSSVLDDEDMQVEMIKTVIPEVFDATRYPVNFTHVSEEENILSGLI